MILDLMGAAQQLLTNITGFILELGCLFMLFCIIFGCIFYFTGWHWRGGKVLLQDGIIGMVILSLLYMWLLGANGPPDISIFFMNMGS
ncbi:MAG: hypothetical protein ACFFCS_26340 [Candidatus Hodarchaeota archaeon]